MISHIETSIYDFDNIKIKDVTSIKRVNVYDDYVLAIGVGMALLHDDNDDIT
jgi:hypothetical protein